MQPMAPPPVLNVDPDPVDHLPAAPVTDAHVEQFTLQASVTPAPGPAARLVRTGAQVGGAGSLLTLWQSFGWLGTDHWTPEQAAARWPALGGALTFVIAVAMNAIGYLRSKPGAQPPVG